MPIRSKKQQACVERYMAAHYGRLSVRWPKEFVEYVKIQATAHQQSIAGYLRQAVEERMIREGVEFQPKNSAKKAEP